MLSENPASPEARFYGCWRSDGKRTRLDRVPHENGFDVFGPRGRFVVVVAYEFTDDGAIAYQDVRVADIRDSRLAPIRRASWEPGSGGVVAVVIKRNGSVALLDRSDGGDQLLTCEVSRCYSFGRSRQALVRLDEGRIKARSVRLDGSRLTWTNRGESRAATLR